MDLENMVLRTTFAHKWLLEKTYNQVSIVSVFTVIYIPVQIFYNINCILKVL